MGNNSEIFDVMATELPRLSEHQKEFVSLIVEGKKPIEAYVEVYSWNRMYFKDEPEKVDSEITWEEAKKRKNFYRAVQYNANKMLKHWKVDVWLNHYRAVGQLASECTFSQHLGELARIREHALKHGQISAAVNAEALRGRAAGHYTEKVEITHTYSPKGILDQIAAKGGHMVELAKKMAEEKGIAWKPPGQTIPEITSECEEAEVIEG